MKPRKCRQCGEVKPLDEYHRCQDCLDNSRNKLRRVVKKEHVEPPLSPWDLACQADRCKRAMEPSGSNFEDVL